MAWQRAQEALDGLEANRNFYTRARDEMLSDEWRSRIDAEKSIHQMELSDYLKEA